MNSSRILLGAAALTLGTGLLAFGATPARPSVPATATAAAQGRQQRTPEEAAKAQVERIDKAVSLTDEQKPKIEAIYVKAYQDMAKARESGDMSQMRTIMGQATKDAQAVCTPDQVAKWPKGGRRGPRGGGF